MKPFTFIFFAIYTICLSSITFAVERIDMQGTSIIGNKEQPNVLYILPWKSADLPEMVELPLSSLINDALQPIDRRTVLRQQNYKKIIKQKEIAAAAVSKPN
jgi:hypothetical protein